MGNAAADAVASSLLFSQIQSTNPTNLPGAFVGVKTDALLVSFLVVFLCDSLSSRFETMYF